ncbi:MAG: SPOR domain-containing protein [Pseudomonadota bacterium]
MVQLKITRSAALAALLISCGLTGLAHADVKSGVAKYEAGDFSGAIQDWVPLAAQNDPNALFNLGQVYRLGRGVEPDMAQAKDFYERAARLGHISAQGNLGTLYFFSENSAVKDQEKAVSWWQEAATNGDARSQYMLGVLFFNGDVVSRDWTRAYAWMSLAAGAGLPEAAEAETSMLKHLSAAQIAEARQASLTLVTAKSTLPNSVPVQFPKSEEPPMPATAIAASAPAMSPEGDLPSSDFMDDDLPLEPLDSAGEEVAAVSAAFKLQLASFTSQETATQAWPILAERHSDVLDSLSPEVAFADLGDRGSFYRLYASGFKTRSEAGDVCDALKAAGQGCLVVSAQ